MYYAWPVLRILYQGFRSSLLILRAKTHSPSLMFAYSSTLWSKYHLRTKTLKEYYPSEKHIPDSAYVIEKGLHRFLTNERFPYQPKLVFMQVQSLSWSNWNLDMLWREKNPQSEVRTNNKLNPHMAPGQNRTRVTLDDERSHYCAIPVWVASFYQSIQLYTPSAGKPWKKAIQDAC